MMSTRYLTELRCFSRLYLFPFFIQIIRSSVVLDASRQHGLHVSDYCPKMKYCPEGAHVMCMYYNPVPSCGQEILIIKTSPTSMQSPVHFISNDVFRKGVSYYGQEEHYTLVYLRQGTPCGFIQQKIYGPRCSNPRNVTMPPELADRLLEVSNAIRSKIARGTEKGKNGEMLPRGYGIFRLSWDKELATFAQVLANQCVLRHDMCRATKRFPDPGQTAGMVRFSYPDWFLISKSGNFSTPGFNDEKLQYATTQTLKSWYRQKSAVTKDMVADYPDWAQNPNMQNGRLYLEMIYGPATHMGCGISAYTEYAFYDNAGSNYNSVQIICNFSARPRTGGAVYNTVPPGDTETPISRCGCPFGSEGDSECLCINKENEKEPLSLPINDCDGASCDPTVVVLPIFTMEDTPPDHLMSSFSNTSIAKSAEIGDGIFDEPEKHFLRNDNKKYLNGQARHLNSLLQTDQKPGIKRKYFDKKDIVTNPVDTRYSRQSLRIPPKHVQKKSSIFTRASKFSLPTTRSNKPYNNIQPIKRDVVARKDFSSAKKLVDKYIYGKRSLLKPIVRKTVHYTENDIHNPEKGNDPNEILKPHSNEEPFHVSDVISHNTESTLSLIEQNVVHHDDFVKDLYKGSLFNHNEPIKSIPATTDNKLMNLLDTLEREVKHIELRDKDKEIFDEKIRKIYGKVVGKPVGGLGIKLPIPDEHEIRSHLSDNHLNDNNLNNNILNDNHLDDNHINVNHLNDNRLNDNRLNDNRLSDNRLNGNHFNVNQLNDNHLNVNRLNDNHLNDNHLNDNNLNDNHLNDNHLNDNHLNDNHLNDNHLNNNHLNDNHLNDIHFDDIHVTDNRLNDNRRNDNRLNDNRLNDNRLNDNRLNDNRLNDNRLNDNRLNLEKLETQRRIFKGNPDILEKHELHKDKNELSFDLYDDPTAPNHHNVQRKVRDRSVYNNRNNDLENIYRNKNSYRNMEHNGIDSREQKYGDKVYDSDFNSYRKDPYKREHFISRKSLPRHDIRDDHKSSRKNYYLNHDGDPLSIERRKYYQDKLDTIERRLNKARNHKRRTVTDERHMRTMLTPHVRKSENQMDSFYMPPDRARFLHGY